MVRNGIVAELNIFSSFSPCSTFNLAVLKIYVVQGVRLIAQVSLLDACRHSANGAIVNAAILG